VRRRRLLGIIAVVLLLAVAGWAIHEPVLRAVARALIVEDALADADALVVLADGAPFRERAVADLFKQGWAPRVIVSRPMNPARVAALVEMGVRPLDVQGESQAALLRFGVPAAALVTIKQTAQITEDELALVREEARSRGWHRLILVSSPEHTRRVKTIWYRRGSNGVGAIVRASPYGNFPRDGWWRERRMAERVLHEYLGLAALYLGVSGWMH
jgi:uncharacterized SAM-binding protein YcdF (DUF218 family)